MAKAKQALQDVADILRNAGWDRPAVEPAPEDTAAASEVRRLKESLAGLAGPESYKMANALSDIEIELARASPDRAEVGKALERVLFYAARSRNFPGWTAAILDPLRAVVAWLGEDWQRLNPETPAGIR